MQDTLLFLICYCKFHHYHQKTKITKFAICFLSITSKALKITPMNFFISSTVTGTHGFKMDRRLNGLDVAITFSTYSFVLFTIVWKNSSTRNSFKKSNGRALCDITCVTPSSLKIQINPEL